MITGVILQYEDKKWQTEEEEMIEMKWLGELSECHLAKVTEVIEQSSCDLCWISVKKCARGVGEAVSHIMIFLASWK